ncbi:MAG TPA: hypothetical protein VF658_19000 [Pyrinomonadaceae bacterium]|jgi:hypothetical protein
MNALMLRCRVCNRRLPFWYISVTILSVAVLASIIFFLERV